MTPYYSDEWLTLYHGDARDIVPRLVSVDALITDPPYGLNANYGRSGRTIAGDGDMELLLWIWAEASRLLPKHGWAGVFTDWRGLGGCKAAAEDAGLEVVTATVWDKVLLGMGGSFRPQYEMFVVAAKGEPRTPYNGGNVVRVARNQTTPDHPHEKPLGLMRRIVEWLCPSGGTILDAFAGSGTTLRAAKDLQRHAVGVELDESYCELIARRAAQESLFAPPPVAVSTSSPAESLDLDAVA